jgi:hypothetical protein
LSVWAERAIRAVLAALREPSEAMALTVEPYLHSGFDGSAMTGASSLLADVVEAFARENGLAAPPEPAQEGET